MSRDGSNGSPLTVQPAMPPTVPCLKWNVRVATESAVDSPGSTDNVDGTLLASGAAFTDLSSWRLLAIGGFDARTWLNDLVSADISGLAPGQAHQSLLALLHHHIATARPATRLQPGVAGAERRVAREGQLATGREDAHAVIRRVVRRRQQERGFGQVGPRREMLHLLVAEVGAVEHHRERVAA